MSYCRFSSDNHGCDVYVYDDDLTGGIAINVAAERLVLPPIPSLLGGAMMTSLFAWSGGAWDQSALSVVYPSRLRRLVAGAAFKLALLWEHWLHRPTVRHMPRRRIGGKWDGASFRCATATEAGLRLDELVGLGYRVPGWLIDEFLPEGGHEPDRAGD